MRPILEFGFWNLDCGINLFLAEGAVELRTLRDFGIWNNSVFRI